MIIITKVLKNQHKCQSMLNLIKKNYILNIVIVSVTKKCEYRNCFCHKKYEYMSIY